VDHPPVGRRTQGRVDSSGGRAHDPVEGGTHDSDGDGGVPGGGGRAIPRPPADPPVSLPAVVTALILDGVDQTIFQSLGFDPPGYQGYDKAMDVYYLAIAYLSTMRNWTSLPAVRVARFLYFYRLVGVVAFELSGWRPLLLIFPNTFEYFFIAYEVVRLFWNPARVSMRLVALGIASEVEPTVHCAASAR
jgi:hypothetical protein